MPAAAGSHVRNHRICSDCELPLRSRRDGAPGLTGHVSLIVKKFLATLAAVRVHRIPLSQSGRCQFKLDGHLAAGIAAMSRFCDSGRSSGTGSRGVPGRFVNGSHCPYSAISCKYEINRIVDVMRSVLAFVSR